MKTGFVQNRNYESFMQAVHAVEKRGAREAGMLLVTGEPGIGKSKVIEKYVSESGALFVRAVSVGSKRGLMMSLAAKDTRMSQKGTSQEIQKSIIGYIAANNVSIVIDECQHLLRNESAAMLEAVRDISDMAECMVILTAGEIGVEHKIAKYNQIASRINKHVQFKPLTMEDSSFAIKQLSEVAFDDALMAAIHIQSGGKMRLIKNAIAGLEAFGKANARSIVTLADIGNKIICEEWQTPRLVRRAA
ncbi:MAG: ATP-binding protein [Oxalobacteraceae bacterium]|nr:ATP-binding protein [Oxalobacteraceae bacterium]